MPEAPYALALTAGMLAAVNPCGFAMLPAYLSLLVVGTGDRPGDSARLAVVRRALVLTGAMALGFVAVFGLFGLLTAPVADVVARNLPWVSIVIGLTLAVLGGWVLAGRELPGLRLRPQFGPARHDGPASMVAFGASYAIASLGCAIGPFLAVVVSAFRSGSSPAAGVFLFLAYAAGMVLIVGLVTLSVAMANVSVVQALRRAAPVINRLAGILLVVAGLYVAWYGWYEIRIRAGAGADPVIDAAGRVQSALSGLLSDVGPVTVAIAFAVLLTAAVTVAVLTGRRRARADRR
jgi:cytochrome c-type biogenesis protein